MLLSLAVFVHLSHSLTYGCLSQGVVSEGAPTGADHGKQQLAPVQYSCSNEVGRMSEFQYTGMENGGRKYTVLLVPDAFDSGAEEECGGNTRRHRRSAFGVESYVAILKLRFNKSLADWTIMTTGRMQPNIETIDFLSAGSPVCRVSISTHWILSTILVMCQVG
ncbi:hypothetical protein MAR_028264 [Mya arenaria]|uniref:Uncharacterized protein n=1 Tax=Mya arenaria TaxID=6604 RepID=A0ABY7DE85_MYAAR|nr:hypothetical protein MAR_028264 [Mya arenaria]